MFRHLFAKLKGVDPFYADIGVEQIWLYQHYVSRILDAVDLENSTRWSRSQSHDRTRLAADDDVMEKIITNEAVLEGLNSAYLQIMVNQYFFADERFREMDKNCWVKRVLNRKDVDYFPDGSSTRRLLEQVCG